jgi:hypothetical protein
MEMSTTPPGAVIGTCMESSPPIRSPARKETLNPFHGQVPVFSKRQVLVNLPPRGTLVLSGIVMSASSTARSLQFAGAGAMIVDSKVAKDKGEIVRVDLTISVGGRVEVIKKGWTCGVLVCISIERQETKTG